MFRMSLVVSVAGALVAVVPLPAQDSAMAVSPGRTVRVHLRHGAKTTGTVAAIDSAGLCLAVTGGATVLLVRDEVSGIDLYQGMRTSVGRRALMGGVIGAAAGALLGAVTAGNSDGFISVGEGAAAFGAVFGVLGAGIGALVGTKPRPVWDPVDWPSVALIPDREGGAGAAVRFVIRF